MKRVAEIELAGRNCTVKLNNLSLRNAERHLEKSIMSVIQEGISVEAVHTLLWVGMRSFEPKLKLNDVYDLVDEAMDEDPGKYMELMEFVIELTLGALGMSPEAEEARKEKKPKAAPKKTEA